MRTASLKGDSGVRQRSASNLMTLIVHVFRRPLFMIAVLYSIAISYERIIEIEVLKPYRVLGMILILGVLLTMRMRTDRISRLAIGFLAVGLIAGLPAFFSYGGRDDVFFSTLLIWTFNIATYLAVAGVVRSRTDIIVLGVIHSIAMLTAAYDIALESAAIEMGIKRAVGDFKNPANATVSMLFAGMVLVSLLRTPWAKQRLTPLLCAILKIAIPLFLLFTASLTGTRSGAAVMVAGFLLYVFLTARQRTMFVALLSGMILVAVVAVGSRFEDGLANLSQTNILAARVDKKGVDTDRLYLWKSGLDSFADTFGLGRGMARYPEVHQEYFAPYAYLSDSRWMDSDLTLHNDYVSALVEHGVIGFVVFLLFCRELFRTARSTADPLMRAIGLSLLLGMAINGMTHTGLPYFCAWFYFALLASWRTLEKRDALHARGAKPYMTRR